MRFQPKALIRNVWKGRREIITAALIGNKHRIQSDVTFMRNSEDNCAGGEKDKKLYFIQGPDNDTIHLKEKIQDMLSHF